MFIELLLCITAREPNRANSIKHQITLLLNHYKIWVCFADQGSGFCVTGKIEAGYIQTGDRLLAMPPNETCTTKGIALQNSSAKQPLS